MKTRAEMLKDRETTKKKSSASERTKDLFEENEESKPQSKTEKTPGKLTCPACESEVSIESLEKRPDGKLICSECAAPIDPKSSSSADDESEEEPEPEPEPEPESKPDVARSGLFCAECGSAWPTMNGKVNRNCGHKNDGVEDPREASNPKKITPGGITDLPNLPPSTMMQPQVAFSGNRLSVGWGKSTFPFGEITNGPKYSNFEVPQSIITVELPQDADRVEAAKRIIAELQKIAELTFQAQYDWYRKKLRSLDA